jgi:predicted regulator of Ras-like GTPase activity (Roadblock/LC7/MglB family)
MPGAISPEEKKAEEPAPAPPKDGLQISLGLRAILQNLPAFQLKGSPEAVAADARVGLPLSLVESQLSTGRIAIPVRIFRDALAPNDRDLITVDEAESPLLLPLQEVLRNLPSAVLKMRDDQEEVDPVEAFETPFSIKAAEDAKRFQETLQVAQKGSAISAVPAVPAAQSNNVAVAPVVKPLALALEAKSQVEEKANTETKSELTVASKAVKKVDANTNAKDMVSRVSALPGVAACSITFEDGLSLAGNLPDDVQVGGLCAMAPSVLQRISRHTVDTKLGPLQSMTLHCGEAKMSFFMKGSVCLTVLHAGGDLTSDTHNKLAQMANELSRTYSQPETVHVDH